MAVILNDTFTGGAGTLDGHTPDTPFQSVNWSTSAASQSGGVLLSGSGTAVADGYYAPATLTDVAQASLGFSNNTNVTFEATFVFTTGPDVGVSGTDNRPGLEVWLLISGITTKAKIYGTYSGGSMYWYMQLNAGAPYDITASIAGSTSYTGVLSVADDAQSFLFTAHTLNDTVSYANSNGLTGVEIIPGGFNGISSISVDASAAGVSAGDLTCPMGLVYSLTEPRTGNFAMTGPVGAMHFQTGANVSLSGPMATIVFLSGGASQMVVPAPAIFAAGHNSYGENAALLTAPSPALSFTTGANAGTAAPSPLLIAEGTGTAVGSADLSAPMSSIDAAGMDTELAQVEMSAPMATIIGYSGAVCSVTLTGGSTVAATGLSGAAGAAALTLPLFSLSASGTAQNSGVIDLIAPSPTMGAGGNIAYLVAPTATLTAIGHAVVAVTYEAYAVNLKHQPKPGNEPVDEVTRYTNFPFTHIVRYKNSYFGANSTGLYLLDGTTDYASPTPTPIPWAFKTAMTDFKSPFQKTVASAYFGGRLGAAATIDLHVGEDGPQTYSYATVRTDHAQNYRQVFGKGTKARYYALGASGTGTLELDDIDLDVHTLSRRI